MATFCDKFNPFRGDIVYGTNQGRTDYIEAFVASKQRKELEARERTSFSVWNTKGYFINDYNEPITNADFSSPSTTEIKANSSAQTHYLGLLNKTRLAPQSVFDTKKTSVTALAKGNVSVKEDTKLTQEEWGKLHQILAVRRACKFGIEYIAHHRDCTVHYVTDYIRMQDVVGKIAHHSPWITNDVVPITTSELRYLFREWGNFRKSKIIFYLTQNPVEPPWYADPDLWLPYAGQRVEKYRETLAKTNAPQLNQFDKAVAKPNAKLAIDWFHDMKVGLNQS